MQLKVPMTDKPNTTVNFRKLLLNRCQKEFEKDKVDDVVFERKQKELDSAASVRGMPELILYQNIFMTEVNETPKSISTLAKRLCE